MKNPGRLLCGILVLVFLAPLARASEPQMGGTFRYAMNSDPEHLDPMITTSWKVVTPARHIFETLLEFDSEWEPVPMLAESYESLDDGMTLVFHLRTGVKFHNGKTMTSQDVAASITRWGKYGNGGATLWNAVDRLETPDDLTFIIRLKERLGGVILSLLANMMGGPVIMPEEIAAAATKEPVPPESIIGTGPYRLVEWIPNRHVKLVRFEEYVPVDMPPDGYAGAKIAYFDTILIQPVPAENTRFAGITVGEFQLVENVSVDVYDQVAADPNLQALLLGPPVFPGLMLDTSEGITANAKIRQAILVALGMEPILQATYGNPEFWELSGSIYPPNTIWYVDEAHDHPLYNQADPERARQLAAEGGYQGEELIFVFPSVVPEIYKFSLVVAEQLGQAGFKIKSEMYDWPTYASVRSQPELFDLASSTFSFKSDPAMIPLFDAGYVPKWDTEEKRDIIDRMTAAATLEERYAAWKQLQMLVYEQVPFISMGFGYPMFVGNAKVEGLGTEKHPFTMPLSFWNTWFAEDK